MTTQLPPLASILGHVLGFLNAYLVPIGIVLVLFALLAIVIARRSGAAAAAPAEVPAATRSPAGPAAAPRSAVAAVSPGAPIARLAPAVPIAAPRAAAGPAPAVAAAPGTEEPSAGEGDGGGSNDDDRRSILVVDDSAVARAMLRRLFEANGYHVVAARDGVEALETLATTHFALLITDLEMPNMNGLELIATVQGALQTEDLPIIAITGHDGLQAHVHEYQRLYGIFKKPWNDRELLTRVAALISLRKRREPSAPLRRSTDARV